MDHLNNMRIKTPEHSRSKKIRMVTPNKQSAYPIGG